MFLLLRDEKNVIHSKLVNNPFKFLSTNGAKLLHISLIIIITIYRYEISKLVMIPEFYHGAWSRTLICIPDVQCAP